MHYHRGANDPLARYTTRLGRCVYLDRRADINVRNLIATLRGDISAQVGAARRLVETWSYGPARLTDRHRDVIATNPEGAAVWGTDNAILYAFGHAATFPDWTRLAPDIVGRFYLDAGLWPDPRYRSLIGDLRGFDDFRVLSDLVGAATPSLPISGSLTYAHAGRTYRVSHHPVAPGHPDELRIALAEPVDAGRWPLN